MAKRRREGEADGEGVPKHVCAEGERKREGDGWGAGERSCQGQTHMGRLLGAREGDGVRDAEHAYAFLHVAALCVAVSAVLSCCKRQ